MDNVKSRLEALEKLKKEVMNELESSESPELRYKREFDKKLKNLIYIYNNELFEKACLYDFPVRTLQRSNNPSIRLVPRVLLGFGEHDNKTLFQVYKENIGYFNWMIKENILSFQDREVSKKTVEYSDFFY